MGKKRQILVSESDPDIDLKFPIHQHSLICDKLIKLVPAKFYLPTDEKEKPWFHGLSKGGAKASAKKRQGKSLRKQGENAIIPRSLLQQPLYLREIKGEEGEESGSAKDEEKKPGTSTSSESVEKNAEEAINELKFSHVHRYQLPHRNH
ncbi:hypothetical protein OIU85_005582 [Salix viminalis]|uniref:Ribosomal RNA-processing protein 14 N-terminal domain-containing protein n=1 Tax=Salix viminalis TaxID=40686 RepID=A0A9Q0STS0_SALVM|nr:hypothetical protein OIU85_005582 [Salix viminalis]